MHQRAAILLLTLITCVVSQAHAEIIDRIAAVVDGRIITASDIRKEHQVRAVLGDSPETDDALLQSMIDDALLQEEMAQYPGLDVTDDDIDERMRTISDLRGVSVSDIRGAISRGIQRYRYLSLRYQQFIVVSNEEIEKYYETSFVPEAKKRGVAVPDLSQVTDTIKASLFEEKLSSELEMSLQTLRARSNIEVFE